MESVRDASKSLTVYLCFLKLDFKGMEWVELGSILLCIYCLILLRALSVQKSFPCQTRAGSTACVETPDFERYRELRVKIYSKTHYPDAEVFCN